MGVGNFTVAEHLQAWRSAFEQARHRGADQVGHQQAGRQADVFLGLCSVGGAAGQRARSDAAGLFLQPLKAAQSSPRPVHALT